jgi:hypothetical protein
MAAKLLIYHGCKGKKKQLEDMLEQPKALNTILKKRLGKFKKLAFYLRYLSGLKPIEKKNKVTKFKDITMVNQQGILSLDIKKKNK